jgi:hypothetical protein
LKQLVLLAVQTLFDLVEAVGGLFEAIKLRLERFIGRRFGCGGRSNSWRCCGGVRRCWCLSGRRRRGGCDRRRCGILRGSQNAAKNDESQNATRTGHRVLLSESATTLSLTRPKVKEQ